MPVVGTEETGQASCLPGVGRPALLLPRESARWDSKILNPERVSIVPDKTLLKVLVCSTASSLCGFPVAMCTARRQRAGALGVSVGLIVGRKQRTGTEPPEVSREPRFEAQQVVSALEHWPGAVTSLWVQEAMVGWLQG